jgi:ABC-type transport system involved in multi-copper enzyme maturation permease subunit
MREFMSRNLYILGATLLLFSVISFGMTFSSGPYQIGMPGNGSLWKTIALFLLMGSLFSVFAGVMTHMYEQVERRAREREIREREMRKRRRS